MPRSHSELVLRVRLEPRTHTSQSRALTSTKSYPESSHWPSRTCISWFSSASTLCLCFMHRQGDRGPGREGLSRFTELEVNNSMRGEGPHRSQAASWDWPAFHLETLSSSPTGCASTTPESQSTRLPAVRQQRSFGLRAPQRGHKARPCLSEPGVTQRGCQMGGLGSQPGS